MAINSKAKGARCEREASQYLSELFGVQFRRGQQFCGANGDADVVSDDPLADKFHFEIKAVERLNIEEAVKQARNDAKPYQVPVVLHKRNRTGWRITIEADNLLQFLDACDEILGKTNPIKSRVESDA